MEDKIFIVEKIEENIVSLEYNRENIDIPFGIIGINNLSIGDNIVFNSETMNFYIIEKNDKIKENRNKEIVNRFNKLKKQERK